MRANMNAKFDMRRGASFFLVAAATLLLGAGNTAALAATVQPNDANTHSSEASPPQAPSSPAPPLQITVTTLPDGTQLGTANPAEVRKLTTAAAAAAASGCLRTCDGLSPEDYITPAGGPAAWYKCSWDAQTVKEVWSAFGTNRIHAELRYSPRCRSAWVRGDPAGRRAYFTAESYFLNGNYRSATESIYEGFSSMLNDANLLAQACYYDPGVEKVCTSRY
jgi:hypothetical protein